jgi:hypothetical protein
LKDKFEFLLKEKKTELLPALEKESVGTVSEELIEDLLKNTKYK